MANLNFLSQPQRFAEAWKDQMNEYRAMSKIDSSDTNSSREIRADQNVTPLADRHPNLTLLETGQNPGELLRSAREKLGYSLSDISGQTRINERQLEAIESGDVTRLPPETFAKAFIKSYCKVLKLESAPVIMLFGFKEKNGQAKNSRSVQGEAGRSEPLEPQMPDSSKRLSTLNFDQKASKKLSSYGIVLAAIVVMAIFYIPVFLANQAVQDSTPEEISESGRAQEASSNPLTSSTPVPAEAGGATLNQLDSPVDMTASKDLAAPLDNSTNTGGDAPIFPALMQPSAPTPPPVSSPEPIVTQSVSGTTPAATPSAGVVNTASLPVKVAPPVVPSASVASTTVASTAVASTNSAPSTQTTLRFNFKEQSWVTVLDANDNVLISQLNDGGSGLDVRGQAPFKLLVGNAKSVVLSSNGRTINLSPVNNRGVARITLQ